MLLRWWTTFHGRFENIAPLVGRRLFFAIETIANETVMDRLASECDIIYHLAAAVGVELVVRDPVHVLRPMFRAQR